MVLRGLVRGMPVLRGLVTLVRLLRERMCAYRTQKANESVYIRLYIRSQEYVFRPRNSITSTPTCAYTARIEVSL